MDGAKSFHGVLRNQMQPDYEGCEGQMELPLYGNIAWFPLSTVVTVSAESPREVSPCNSFIRNDTTQETASTGKLSTISQACTGKRRPEPTTRLFSRRILALSPAEKLFVFKSSSDVGSIMLVIIGKDKVPATEQIAKVRLLRPSAWELTNWSMKHTLQQIVVKMQELRYALAPRGGLHTYPEGEKPPFEGGRILAHARRDVW